MNFSVVQGLSDFAQIFGVDGNRGLNAARLIYTNPEYDDSFLLTVIPQGLGSMVPLLAASATLGPTGALVFAGVQGAGRGLGDWREMERESKEVNYVNGMASVLLKAGLGATEVIPLNRFWSRADDVFGGVFNKVFYK